MNANQHLSGRGLELIKTEREGVPPSQVPQIGPLGVSEVHGSPSLLDQPQEHLLEGEGYGLVPLGWLCLSATSQRHLQQVSKVVVVLQQEARGNKTQSRIVSNYTQIIQYTAVLYISHSK